MATENEVLSPTTNAGANGLATNESAPAGSVVLESQKPSEDDNDDGQLIDLFSGSVEQTPSEEAPVPVNESAPQGVEQVPAVPSQPEPVVTQPVPVVASPPPVVAPQAAAPAQGTQPQVPVATQPTPQQGTPAQAPANTEPEVDPFTQLDRTIEAQRPKVIEAVALGTYQLSQEDLDGLSVNPEKTVPKLLAQVHVNAVQGVLRHVTQNLPGMLNSMLQVREISQQRENKFWSAWPALDKSKHAGQVMQVARVFRQMNPTATEEDFVRHVGAQVMLMNNLQRAPTAAQPVQPAAPVPFRPAGAGQGGTQPVPAAPQQLGGWDVISQLMQQED